MLRIGQLKLNPDHSEQDLIHLLAKTLRISEKEILKYEIRKRSLDARKKPQIKYIYTVDVLVANESKTLKKHKNNQISLVK